MPRMIPDNETEEPKAKVVPFFFFTPCSLCFKFIFKALFFIYSFLQQTLLCAYYVAGTVPGSGSRIKSDSNVQVFCNTL